MKKLVVATVIGLTPALVGTSALADGHGMGGSTYVGVSGVGTFVNDVDGDNGRTGTGQVKTTAALDPSLGALLRVGHKFDMFRAELELGYRNVDVDGISSATGSMANPSGDATALSALVNGIYDIETDTPVTPYIMVGAGIMNIDGDISYNREDGALETQSADGTTVAGQVGLGLSYELTPEIDLVGGYSFLGAPTDKTGDDQVIMMHSAHIGINYSF